MPLRRAEFLRAAARAFEAARSEKELQAAWARQVAGVYPWCAPELARALASLHARRFLALSFSLT